MTPFRFIDDELWYFPHGVGKGVGLLVTRATPIRFPRWHITTFYGQQYSGAPAESDEVHMALLKLPRNKHG